jgi:hypothetical protein
MIGSVSGVIYRSSRFAIKIHELTIFTGYHTIMTILELRRCQTLPAQLRIPFSLSAPAKWTDFGPSDKTLAIMDLCDV